MRLCNCVCAGKGDVSGLLQMFEDKKMFEAQAELVKKVRIVASRDATLALLFPERCARSRYLLSCTF